MGARLDETTNQYADALKTRWPLEEMLGVDLIAAAGKRIESRLSIPVKTETMEEGLWVKVDSFSLIQAMTYLASRLYDNYEIRELRFRLSSEGRLAYFDLIWQGPPVSSETIFAWELEPMTLAGETTPLTLRDVTERHGGEIWFQREKAAHRAFFRLVVPVANPQETPVGEVPRGESRPEYYDFDLFNFSETSDALLDRRLAELAYTVFDTETTGLDPSAGDEIIQIGAARIVNGRLLGNETFDHLIDPQRPLRIESIKIHGITEDMVHGQPTIGEVLPEFHAFAVDTVLVAHNAAFDMRFLQLKETSTGVRFAQPVLDTLLLSAVIHPNQETHKLEAIAARLGINVIGRHTALGDAIVTGEVFLKMIPLLAEAGVTTLREALAASEKTYLARVKY
jgi:DNA polymerase-3 subunit epsilon